MKIAIIDKLGLCYDGDTLKKQGLGGSESAVIYISKELASLGFDVTVFNNCIDASHSKPGIYDNVRYIDNSLANNHNEQYDIVIVSRSIVPFTNNDYPFLHTALKRILWLHDTFIEGDQIMESLAVSGKIDHIFTLSDWHTSYILNSDHGNRRNYEVLKKKIFQTRNGAVCHIPEVDLSKKDPNHFVYNSSATKGMIPLLEHIWPEIKQRLPEARLTIIGGYYRFREGATPDEQENTVSRLASDQRIKNLGVTFTGVIKQQQIAEILANAYMMLYPGAFPETFGISAIESLLYKTPLVTTRFGALEETAVEKACYLIDYAIEPNSLFQKINKKEQIHKFLDMFFSAYNNKYLHQQKQNYCDVIKDIAGWDSVALQWTEFFYKITGKYMDIDDYQKVKRINDKVSRIFGRTSVMPAPIEYKSFGTQRRIVVVSPFWNAEKFIEDHIMSVAQQDYDNYLHVLVDDASEDNSYNVARIAIASLPVSIRDKFIVLKNETNLGCVQNQLGVISSYALKDDIVMLLDGDDFLVNNPTLFHYYNDLYDQGYEFTYGSMWSIADNIPLIAQEYPKEVKENKTYRQHMFNWKIPYTHLRTCLGTHFQSLNESSFMVNGEWMKSGADNPMFYELIERVDYNKIFCNREIVCLYNDASPYNDYKIHGEEQNKNANTSYKNKKFSVIVPTMWRALGLFEKSLVNMVSHNLVGEILVINNDVDKTPNWEVLKNSKIKMLNQAVNIKVNPAWNLGVKESSYDLVCIVNDDLWFDSQMFNKIHDHIDASIGVYGFIVGGDKFNQPSITDGSIDLIEWSNGISSYGFGQLMVMDKSNWIPIIDGLDIYFGDDYILHRNIKSGKKTYLIANMNYEEDFGATTRDLGIWQQAYDKEKPIFEAWLNNNMESEMNKKILIAIPTNRYIEPETFKSIYDLEVPNGYELEFQYFYGYQIDQIRNLIAEWAKRYDYLLSIDSDIIVPKDALKKMIAINKDIVTGMYIQRIPNTHTLELYMVNETGGVSNIPYESISPHFGNTIEIAGCGFGCCLIKGDVFRAMEYPHFHYKSAIDHKDTVSEDIFFCQKARSIGFQIWVDTTISCDHKGSTFFRAIKETHNEEIKNEQIIAVNNEPQQSIAKIVQRKDEGITVIPDNYRNGKVFR